MLRGLYLGRFQPYHLGHHEVLKKIATEVSEIIIGIGSAQISHEIENPFTAGERVLMVSRAIEELGIKHYVIPIEDIRRNSLWVSHVMSMVPPFDVAYTNNPLVIELLGEAGVDVRESPLFKRNSYSGTEIRRRMLENDRWEHFVPGKVVEIIQEINGVKRLRKVSQSDDE
ncbi:MAG: nicotinamide-nucleotide adenylyltransferase [Candidatus Methanoperedenaceae archaeon]|nr:nicotinamide-nucleotide adenylyltransferase [Candidatus Methanoperedenaceae archaeon]MDW7725707.1 nicotinamide-nucleotide adenylyltransferase [Candidatus Methanoperedens sp.]